MERGREKVHGVADMRAAGGSLHAQETFSLEGSATVHLQHAHASSTTTHRVHHIIRMRRRGGPARMLQLCSSRGGHVSQARSHVSAFSQVQGSPRGKLTWGQSSGISIL